MHISPFNRGWWQNLVDFVGWRLGGMLRPSTVDWTKQFTVPGRLGGEEPLLASHQYV